jgi:hypothetical protein
LTGSWRSFFGKSALKALVGLADVAERVLEATEGPAAITAAMAI